MQFHPNRPEPYEIEIQGEGFREVVTVKSRIETYEKTISIPAKGAAVIRFRSEAEPLRVPNELRRLVFAVYNFKLRDADAMPPDTVDPKDASPRK